MADCLPEISMFASMCLLKSVYVSCPKASNLNSSNVKFARWDSQTDVSWDYAKWEKPCCKICSLVSPAPKTIKLPQCMILVRKMTNRIIPRHCFRTRLLINPKQCPSLRLSAKHMLRRCFSGGAEGR